MYIFDHFLSGLFLYLADNFFFLFLSRFWFIVFCPLLFLVVSLFFFTGSFNSKHAHTHTKIWTTLYGPLDLRLLIQKINWQQKLEQFFDDLHSQIYQYFFNYIQFCFMISVFTLEALIWINISCEAFDTHAHISRLFQITIII